MEQVYCQNTSGHIMRSFSFISDIPHRGYSHPLQRRVTDFGSDNAFAQVQLKLKEHYGIELPNSAPRSITLKHAAKITLQQEKKRGQESGTAKSCVISETDGSMVPIVSIDREQQDRRKKKLLHYREARLTLAHEKGSNTPIFSGTFKDTQTAGKHLSHCVNRIGKNKETHIHCVGDGAAWIANQVEEHFGNQATYLIDFYHVCEYLAAAASACDEKNKAVWIDTQKQLLKNSRSEEVIKNLLPFIEHHTIEDSDAPVRACHRYLKNRLHQLDYKKAIDNDLPIGSGEIESAHRYIIQKRLKIQGAWWLEESAENMIALRTHRANNDWDAYWKQAA